MSALWDYIISISTKIVSTSASQEISSNLRFIMGSKSARASKLCLKDSQLNNVKVLSSLLSLARKVGFQNLSGSVYCLLSNIACKEDFQNRKNKKLKLTPRVTLAFESIFDNGLELASHSQDCWKHIFKCCHFIKNIEEDLYNLGKNLGIKMERASISKSLKNSETSSELKTQSDEIWLGFIAKPETNQYDNVAQILKEENIDIDKNEPLSPEVLSKCISFLTQNIDKLFSDASSHLNLMSFLGYLRELCFQSHKELILLNNRSANGTNLAKQDTFLITHLSEAMLRCIR